MNSSHKIKTRTAKLAHLTSPHPRTDTRIFIKECSTLARAGYDVSLIVADKKDDEVKNGVKIFGVIKRSGRFNRIKYSPKDIFKKALEIDADVYHLHDPELIPTGLKLKKLGKKVIFDAHEDVPKQLLNKSYLNSFSRKLLSFTFGLYEKWALKKFDLIVAATPFIKNKFAKWHHNVVDINNYPVLGELHDESTYYNQRPKAVAYVGDISAIRGIREILKSLEYCSADIQLNLAGKFSPVSLGEEVKEYATWIKVNEMGFLNRDEIRSALASSRAGLVTLHPTINYLDSLPVKMFEYMSAGLPVIASNFPLWKGIIEGNDCGICVDPLDPKAIAAAINFLFAHPTRAEEMGKNGKKAVEDSYNWRIEEKKLIDSVDQIVG
jgi:glycosyltransferase involved in cell wall biosynthesis